MQKAGKQTDTFYITAFSMCVSFHFTNFGPTDFLKELPIALPQLPFSTLSKLSSDIFTARGLIHSIYFFTSPYLYIIFMGVVLTKKFFVEMLL